MTTNEPDWTAHDGRSNSSPEFHAATAVIEDIIRSSAHTLISGRADAVAGTILATLAHRHGLRPGGSGTGEPDVDRARRALRAFVQHLDAAPSAAVLDALNSALLAYDPPPNEPPGDDLRAALKVVADGRAYTREHFSRPPTGYVGHTPAAEYDAAVDAIVAGLTDILDSTPPGPSPHTDLREAILARFAPTMRIGLVDAEPDEERVQEWAEHLATWAAEEAASHVVAAVQQARADGAAEALREAADSQEQHDRDGHVPAIDARGWRLLRERADRIAAGGEQRG